MNDINILTEEEETLFSLKYSIRSVYVYKNHAVFKGKTVLCLSKDGRIVQSDILQNDDNRGYVITLHYSPTRNILYRVVKGGGVYVIKEFPEGLVNWMKRSGFPRKNNEKYQKLSAAAKTIRIQ